MKRYFITIGIVFSFCAFYSCNHKTINTEGTSITEDSLTQSINASESNSEFPYEKAKQAALQSIENNYYIIGNVLGYYKESDNKIRMFMIGSDGSRWIREFVLLSNDTKDAVWLMLIPPFGSSDTKFELIK